MFAKTVTNKLPQLTVLAKGFFNQQVIRLPVIVILGL
jgi:hypothetical protein